MNTLDFYDGSHDKSANKTLHTVAVTSCGIVTPSQNDSMTLRRQGRTDWSLFYCERGKIIFEGQTVNAGEAFIYPPAVLQSYRTYSRDNTLYAYLHFGGSCVEELLQSLDFAFCVPIKRAEKSVFNLFSRVSKLMLSDSIHAQLRAESLVLLLLSRAAGEETKSKPSTEQGSANALIGITDKMAHCFAEEYDARVYAAMLNLSLDRFQHLFKECMGISPYAYYLSLRMENAARLLADTDLKIKDIAECSGYRDPLYFTQAFRKTFGMTPREYRNADKNFVQTVKSY